MAIDCHIHLFERALPRIDDARHDPIYDARLARLQAIAKPYGIDRFVVVQPSFLGCDNSHLLDQIRLHPTELRGVVVLDPWVDDALIDGLNGAGVAGIRLNLLKTDLGRSLGDAQLSLVDRCASRGLSVEIHDDIARLPGILRRLEGHAGTIVIDHFGRPESTGGQVDDALYDSFLRELSGRDVYVKLSAAYRSPGLDAARALARLRTSIGDTRLLWGSDWPSTQHEDHARYEPFTALDRQLRELWPTLQANAEALYGFDTRPTPQGL